MASSVRDAVWLEWVATLMGGASRPACATMLSPDRFSCRLDELPLHLVPQRLFSVLRRRFDRIHQFSVNPLVTVLPQGKAPVGLVSGGALLRNFALRGTVAWVREAGTESISPFWLSPEMEKALAVLDANVLDANVLDANNLALSTFAPEVLFLFAASGILVGRDHTEQSMERRRAEISAAAAVFRERGYAPINGLIHPFHLGALRRYYRYLIRRGRIRLGDGQSPRRYVAHNESVARFFHHQIAGTVSAVVRQPVKPSYVYLASYLGGADLKKHTDRAQCEFSVTLCLDFSPEPVNETSWPIYLDTPKGQVAVYQSLGDGLVYRGTRVPHYRGVLPAGQTSTSIFFHYVAADFEGSLA